MIVRPRPHWIRLLFVRRGSLVHRIVGQQLFIFALSVAVVMAHGQRQQKQNASSIRARGAVHLH